MRQIAQTKGYIALTTMTILGAVLLLLVTAGFGAAVSRNRTQITHKQSVVAGLVVESCVEETLFHLLRDGVLPSQVLLPEGECNVVETGITSSVVSFEVSGLASEMGRSIRVRVDTAQPMRILSWDE